MEFQYRAEKGHYIMENIRPSVGAKLVDAIGLTILSKCLIVGMKEG